MIVFQNLTRPAICQHLGDFEMTGAHHLIRHRVLHVLEASRELAAADRHSIKVHVVDTLLVEV